MIYRGITVYEKPGRLRTKTGDRKIAGECYFSGYRRWVPQQDTVADMEAVARSMINAELDAGESITTRWFKQGLV